MTWEKGLGFEVEMSFHCQMGSTFLVQLPACLLGWFCKCYTAFGYRRNNTAIGEGKKEVRNLPLVHTPRVSGCETLQRDQNGGCHERC